MDENLSKPPEAVSLEEIQAMIANLAQVGESDLRQEMGKLKVALLSNPAACNMLLPADIGEMVKHLMKISNKVIVEAKQGKMQKAGKKDAKVNLDPKVLDQMIDEM